MQGRLQCHPVLSTIEGIDPLLFHSNQGSDPSADTADFRIHCHGLPVQCKRRDHSAYTTGHKFDSDCRGGDCRGKEVFAGPKDRIDASGHGL